jgi:glycosyltransferase involved in cell wall biosynthesis
MRVAVLWTHLSGYLNACLRELHRAHNVDLFVAHMVSSKEAPFDEEQFAWLENRFPFKGRPDRQLLLKRVEEFGPDILYVCSWHIAEYRYIAKRVSGKALRCFFMDNPWRGTFKQWLGVITSKWYLHPLFEAVLLPGERQALFARKLGFTESQILRGMYSCDHPAFRAAYGVKAQRGSALPKAFVYVGRFSKEKGIDTLARAFKKYVSMSPDPWPLHCYGAGELQRLLEDIHGVELCGFVQPYELPTKFAAASCLILPSVFEPWGLVIHEATAAGLAVICTSACGASVHLVQDGYNGYIVEPANPDHLASTMLRYTKLSEAMRREMSANSYNLSLQYTPQRWAEYFFERLQEMLTEG